MECKDLRDLVVRHSSGDLSGDERALVESHLPGCGECSELFSHSNAVWMLLDEWKEIEPRSDYVSEFWSRVEKEESRAGFWGSLFKSCLSSASSRCSYSPATRAGASSPRTT